jgi:hypothetical protein
MDRVTKAAQWAQIISVFPGLYSAYGTYVALSVGSGNAPPPTTMLGITLLTPTAVLIAFMVTLFLLGASALMNMLSARSAARSASGYASVRRGIAKVEESKLKIHSARWGTDSDYFEVAHILNGQVKGDSLVIAASNDEFGDPAKGNTNKKLTVAYSFGGGAIKTAVRPESADLMLPEDPWLLGEIERLQANRDEHGDNQYSKPKLVGEIIEAVFQDFMEMEDAEESSVTLHVSVSNASRQATTIKSSQLVIETPERSFVAQRERLLGRFTLRRSMGDKPLTLAAVINTPPESLPDFEDVGDQSKAIGYHEHLNGWLRFVVSDGDFTPVDLHTMTFRLTLIDALNNEHVIVRNPAPWKKIGTLEKS